MLTLRRLGAAVLVAASLTACGTASHQVAPVPTPVASHCQAGHSYMGCASGVAPTNPQAPRPGASERTIAGPKFPDVSSYQGHPDWARIKPYVDGAIVKEGEYTVDPDFYYNADSLKALHMRWGAYWFVRNTGCAHEASQVVDYLRPVGLPNVIVLDIEVPEAAGYAPCLASQIHSALGVYPVIYTAPGTWPGGSTAGLKLWLASYGPSIAPTLYGQDPVAWQFASPPYVDYYIPGLGVGDVSVDYGIFGSSKPAPAHKPVVCDAHARGIPKACLKLFVDARFHGVNERQAATTYKYHRRQSRRSSLVLLRNRLWFVAHHERRHGHWVTLRHGDWNFHRGFRFQRLARDAAGR